MPKITITPKYDYFDKVYLITDPDQNIRQVVRISIDPARKLIYLLSFNGEESEHYEEEISGDRNVI